MQRVEWSARLDALVVFRGLLDAPLVQALRAALDPDNSRQAKPIPDTGR